MQELKYRGVDIYVFRNIVSSGRAGAISNAPCAIFVTPAKDLVHSACSVYMETLTELLWDPHMCYRLKWNVSSWLRMQASRSQGPHYFFASIFNNVTWHKYSHFENSSSIKIDLLHDRLISVYYLKYLDLIFLLHYQLISYYLLVFFLFVLFLCIYFNGFHLFCSIDNLLSIIWVEVCVWNKI